MHSARSCREAQKGGAKGRRKARGAGPMVVFFVTLPQRSDTRQATPRLFYSGGIDHKAPLPGGPWRRRAVGPGPQS